MINQRLQELNSTLQRIDTEIEHIHVAISTLEDLSKGASEKELVIPIGAETFLTVKSDDVKTVKQSVGAGVIVEKQSDKAIEYLKKRSSQLSQQQQEYAKAYEQVVEKSESLQRDIESRLKSQQQ